MPLDSEVTKTYAALVISVEVPHGYTLGLTSEPNKGGGYLYTGHLYGRGKPAIDFDLVDVTSDFQRAVADRIRSAIAKAK